jgi:branched-chain amino acid transport system permease protein
MFFGSAILIIFPEVSRFMMDYRFVLYGLILVLMMRFRPQGIMGWQSRLPYRFSKFTGKQLQAEGLLALTIPDTGKE